MKYLGLFILAFGLAFGLFACDDNGDDPKVSVEVIKAFEQKFPGITQVDWDVKGRFYVAEFDSVLPDNPELSMGNAVPGAVYEHDAWFDFSANWKMTVVEIPYNMLPPMVQSGFAGSEYGTWRVEDAAVISRNGVNDVYAVEVRREGHSRYLYFNSEGVLTKEEKDNRDYMDLIL